jgi:hypothetical protein
VALPARSRALSIAGFISLMLLSAVLVPTFAGAVVPTDYTTTISSITRDTFGNPKTAIFKIAGPAHNYEVCLTMDAGPAQPTYNTRVGSAYDSYTYSSYKPCNKFSWSTSTSNSHHIGTHFTFGGPGIYTVHWYVPDKATGIEVGTAQTLRWANSKTGTLSPCPWDPQLQIGVWRPSRHQILNRCKTVTGVAGTRLSSSELDSDRNWGITVGSTKIHVEYVLRDANIYTSPTASATYTLTGVYVCDTYHGWKEIHPVFLVKDSNNNYTLSGPQYSTSTPSVSGTWTLHSCA